MVKFMIVDDAAFMRSFLSNMKSHEVNHVYFPDYRGDLNV